MRRAHDKSSSSGWQEDQAGQTGQQTGATGTGPGTASGAQATGGSQEQYSTTTRTYEGSGQQTQGYPTRTEQRGGYAPQQRGGYAPQDQRGGGPMSMEHGASTVHGGLFLTLAGLLTFLSGLAFIVRHSFYHSLSGYAYNWDIRSWGWVLFALGIVTFAVGASHLLGLPFSRHLGIVMAVLTAVAGFMVLAFYPLWGIIIVALGLASLWGLAHGAQSREARRMYESRQYEDQRHMM